MLRLVYKIAGAPSCRLCSMSGSKYTFRIINLIYFMNLCLWQKDILNFTLMKKIDSLPGDFFFPLFLEIYFTVSRLAAHPLYELEMQKSNIILNEHVDIIAVSRRFGEEMFRKLTEINTYDYFPFMVYQLQNIVDKREWIKNFILLTTVNKDLFISQCGIENYAFLFKMATDHCSALNTIMLGFLSCTCNDCNHRVKINIKHDVDLIKQLDGPEKTYYCSKLKFDLRLFANFKDLKFDSSEWENLKYECDMIEIENQLMEGLKEAYVKKGLANLEGLKPIIANCSTDFFAKKFGEFLNECEDEKGNYVFDFTNLSVSNLIPFIFEFPKAKNISPSSFRDKLPSKAEYIKIRNNSGKKR